MNRLAIALLAALPGSVQSPPTFTSGVEAVSVDVFVTDRNGPVIGLTAADFELRDDGVPQRVELAAVGSVPLPTLLVLDTSGSVSGPKLVQLQVAGRALLDNVRPSDRVGLLTFDHEIRVRVAPTSDHARVGRELRAITAGGTTALYDALYAGVLLAPARERSLLVVFTDGEDNLSWLSAPEVKQVLLGADVLVHAVGILPNAGREQVLPLGLADRERTVPEPPHVRVLRQLAETTGGRFWAASAPQSLASAFVAILDAMKTRYILRFEPPVQRRPGLHALDVRLTRRRGTVHSRRAYLVGPLAR